MTSHQVISWPHPVLWLTRFHRRPSFGNDLSCGIFNGNKLRWEAKTSSNCLITQKLATKQNWGRIENTLSAYITVTILQHIASLSHILQHTYIQYWNTLHICKTPCRTWWKSSCSSQTLHLISSQNTEKEKNHYMRIRDTQLDHIWRAKICIFDGHIWHIWARIWARQIWSSGVSLKRSCKMQFRRVVFRSIGPSTQNLWPYQFVCQFPHCNYNVKLQSGGRSRFTGL